MRASIVRVLALAIVLCILSISRTLAFDGPDPATGGAVAARQSLPASFPPLGG